MEKERERERERMKVYTGSKFLKLFCKFFLPPDDEPSVSESFASNCHLGPIIKTHFCHHPQPCKLQPYSFFLWWMNPCNPWCISLQISSAVPIISFFAFILGRKVRRSIKNTPKNTASIRGSQGCVCDFLVEIGLLSNKYRYFEIFS